MGNAEPFPAAAEETELKNYFPVGCQSIWGCALTTIGSETQREAEGAITRTTPENNSLINHPAN